MSDDTLRETGFCNKEELFLYQDVCCTDVPLEKEEFNEIFERRLNEIKHGKNKGTKAKLFKKELYLQYMDDNMLWDLFNKVKDMKPIDRLTEIYIYYFNKLYLCAIVRREFELKKDEAIELFDGEKEQEYRNLISETYLEEDKYNSLLEFILTKKDERLVSNLDKEKFDKMINELHQSYVDFIYTLGNIDGRQR